MKKIDEVSLSIDKSFLNEVVKVFNKRTLLFLTIFLAGFSIVNFAFFYLNGLGLSYNDARSHLDIGRRVVEGLKPGLAQLGSVWLPLPHGLMIPFIWNDWLWHSGLAGAIWSMTGYVLTGILIYLFLGELGVGKLGRIVAVLIFALNINVIYLQSTAMTELLVISTITAATYYFLLWSKKSEILDLVKSAFWVMLATLSRYDGWFLLAMISGLLGIIIFTQKQSLKEIFSFKEIKSNYKKTEGLFILFCTLGGLGIALWFLWNLLIFGDPLFFAFGPYSAHAQQLQLDNAGDLLTKGNLPQSIQTYLYAFFYNTNAFISIIGIIGGFVLWFDKKLKLPTRIATLALTAPIIFNIIALYLGHSVLFIQGINGETWFNVRYGISPISTVAIYAGFLVDRLKSFRIPLIGLIAFIMFFSFANFDAVTIDDARVGSSQKNVSEVSSWLALNAKDKPGFILISVASHDAIIFSSGLPMKKFIHEGTGAYWDSATTSPDRWARWIVMRTYDDNDSTWKLVKATDGFAKYRLVDRYPFASIYELRDEYLGELNTEPVLGKQK